MPNIGGSIQSIAPSTSTGISSFGDPRSFAAAGNQQASDYDKIMKSYEDIIKNFGQSGSKSAIAPVDYKPVEAKTTDYQQSADVSGSLGALKKLTDTGGFSAADINNIRERDISPIRSIYAQGQQELERNRAISGGYSPSYNATAAQMARDEAQKISDVTGRANADIAENVAKNKIATAGAYGSAAASANAAKAEADQKNADIVNRANEQNAAMKAQIDEFNRSLDFQRQNAAQDRVIGAVHGQANLYGTTPALTKTFGDQVIQANQAGQQQQQINNKKIVGIGGISGGSVGYGW